MSLGMEDYDAHLRMLSNGVRGVALPQVYFNYRIRSASMSRAFDPDIQAFLYRQLFRNHAGFYAQHGARLAPMFAENGHGAFAGAPTGPSRATLAPPMAPAPDVEAVEHELELTASRTQLSQALRGLARQGGLRWSYVVGRLLLALDVQPAFAERVLAAAADAEPANGWPRLYAMIAHLRSGRFTLAERLWSPALRSFFRAERDAVLWITEFEAVRGCPHVALALRVMASRELGWRPGAAGDWLDEPTHTCDAQFPALRRALAELGRAAAEADRFTQDTLHDVIGKVLGAAAPLVSAEAADVLIDRWRLNWSASGRLDPPASLGLEQAIRLRRDPKACAVASGPTPATGFWNRPSPAYGSANPTPAATLSLAEQQDARSWAAAYAEAFDATERPTATPHQAAPAMRPRERIARLGRLLR